MGLLDYSSSPMIAGATPQGEPPERSLFEKATSPIFELLDVPGNAVRSLVVGDPMNALKTLTPFVPARKVEGSEVIELVNEKVGTDFDTESFINQVGAEVLFDPLMPVSGIGGLTKAGAMSKRLRQATKAAKYFDRMGNVSDAKIAQKLADDLTEALKAIEPKTVVENGVTITTGKRQPNRYVLKLVGGKEIGDMKKITNALAAVNIFPDPKIPVLAREIEKKSRTLAKIDLKNIKETGDVYYHGTPGSFDEPLKGSEIWATTNPHQAEMFAGGAFPSDTPNLRPIKIKGKIIHDSSPEYKEIVTNVFKGTKIPVDDKTYNTLTFLRDSRVIKAVKDAGYTAVETGTDYLGQKTNSRILQIVNKDNIIPMSSPDFTPKYTRALNRKQKLEKQLTDLDKELKTSHKGMLDPITADKIRAVRDSFVAKFRSKARDPNVELLKDIQSIEETRLKNIVDADAALMINRFNKLEGLKTMGKAAQMERLLLGAEYRGVQAGTTPTVENYLTKESRRIQDKYTHRLQVIKDNKTKTDIQKLFAQQKALNEATKAVKSMKIEAERRRLRLDEAAKHWGSLSPEEIEFLDHYVSHIEFLPEIEENAHLVSKSLESDMLSYMTRLVSPQALKLKKESLSKYNLMLTTANARLGFAMKRKVLPEEDMLAINRLMRDEFGIDYDFYNVNIIESMKERRYKSIEAVTRAKTVQIAAEEFAAKGLDKDKSTALRDVYEKMGLDWTKAPKGLRIPNTVFDDMRNVDRILQKSVLNNQPQLVKTLKLIDNIQSLVYRAPLTVLFPDYHTRNLVGNIFNNHLAGVNNPKYYLEGFALRGRVAKGKLSATDKEFWELAQRYGVVGRGESIELDRFFNEFGKDLQPGAGKNWLEGYKEFLEHPTDKFLKTIKLRDKASKKAYEQYDHLWGRGYARYVEDASRLAHFKAKLDAGLSPLEAAQSVKKYLFDYSQLTNFEKQYMRPLVMFYSWTRKNLPLQVAHTMQHPRLAAAYMHFTGINQDEVPEYLKGSRSFPSPFGGSEVIGSLGLPIEDLNIFNVRDADPNIFDQISRFGDRVISKTAPIVRLPAELAMGRTTFTRKDLRNLSNTELLKEFTPAARLVRTGEKVINPDEPLGFKMLDLMTGLRTYSIDPKKVQVDNLKRNLLASGRFRRDGFLVRPKEEFKEDARTKAEYSRLQKLIRDNAKERKRNRGRS